LFKGWIRLATGKNITQWISVNETNHAIRWMVIYPMDSVFHFSDTHLTQNRPISFPGSCLYEAGREKALETRMKIDGKKENL